MFDKSNLSNIGEQVKKARGYRKITQAKLGQKINLDKSKISMIESGKQMPSLEQLADIANALEVRMEYLLSLDTTIDKEMEFVKRFINSFTRVTTTKNYAANIGGAYAREDIIFLTSKDYLVLKGQKSLFALIKAIAKAENQRTMLSKRDYAFMIQEAKKDFINSKDSTEEESYFFISSEQMTEIIDQAVKDEVFVAAALCEKPIHDLKLNVQTKDEQK